MELFIVAGACLFGGYVIGVAHMLWRIAQHIRAHDYVCKDCGHRLRDEMTGKGHTHETKTLDEN